MAPKPQTQDTTFERTLRDFKDGLTVEQQKEFGATTLYDLKVTIAVIQKKQASTRTRQYLKRIEGFLEAMQQNGQIVETFLNVHNFVAFIWVSRLGTEEPNSC